MCPPWFSYPYPRYPSWPYHPSYHLQEFNNQPVFQQEQSVSRQPQQQQQQHSVMTTSSVAATSFSHPDNHDSQTSYSRNYFKPIIVSSHNTAPPNDLRVKDIEEANDKKREARILDTPLFARDDTGGLSSKPSEFERSSCEGNCNNQTSERETTKESNLFDVLKVLREATRRKISSNRMENKYKRFSMNNFEDLKCTVTDLMDFSSRKDSNKIFVTETENNESELDTTTEAGGNNLTRSKI